MAALLHGRARRRDAVLTKELTHLSQTSLRSSKIWIGLQREIDPNDSAHAVEVRVEADAEEDGRLPRTRRVGHLHWATTHGRCGRASSSRFAPPVVATRRLEYTTVLRGAAAAAKAQRCVNATRVARTFGPISSRTMSFSLKNIICEGPAMGSRSAAKGACVQARRIDRRSQYVLDSTHLHARLQIRRSSLGRETERMLQTRRRVRRIGRSQHDLVDACSHRLRPRAPQESQASPVKTYEGNTSSHRQADRCVVDILMVKP